MMDENRASSCSYRTEIQEHKLMTDQESNSVVPDQNDDTTDQLYELIGLLDRERPTQDSKVSSVADVPKEKTTPAVHRPVGEDNWRYTAEGTYNPNRNPYEEQYYMQHMHLSNVLERGLTGIHSELGQLSRSVLQLAYGMKECADTMAFYTTRTLAFQKEMLNIASKTKTYLQTGVHLLQEPRAKDGPCLRDTSKANIQDGKPARTSESRSKRLHRDVEPSSSEDNDLHNSKRK